MPSTMTMAAAAAENAASIQQQIASQV
jgi:hypothetical protein